MVLLVQHAQPGIEDGDPPRPARMTSEEIDHATFAQLFQANSEWAAEMRAQDPAFFDRLSTQQSPELFWVGCADSRVPANQILGLAPGEVFVHRNVGNQAQHSDMNMMACLEYAVKVLKVKSIILCGHHGCGAIRAALQPPTSAPGSLVGCWLGDLRGAARGAAQELTCLCEEERVARLCEINVVRQVLHICTSPVVQAAWAGAGSELRVWGLVYDLRDGLLRRVAGPYSAGSQPDGTSLPTAPFPTPTPGAPAAARAAQPKAPREPGGSSLCSGNSAVATP